MSLSVEHVNKWFGSFQAIKDLSMEVKRGHHLRLRWPQRRGQNHHYAHDPRYLRPNSGADYLGWAPVRAVPRRELGLLPEERGLYPRMEVQEQLLFLARLSGISVEGAHESALDEWLERFQITALSPQKC